MSSPLKFDRDQGGFRSLLHSFRHSLRDIALALLIGIVFGAALTEAVAAALTRAWPTLNVHLAALAIGLLLGYAAAVTMALRETIRGVASSLVAIGEEIEHLGSRVTHEFEERIGHTDNAVATNTVTASQPLAQLPEPAPLTAKHNGHGVATLVRPLDG